jgi:citrate lyase subunit beta/citryl-CoA lyase
MQSQLSPRRSVLFMPASNVRALEKARELDADGLIFDLEDAVAPDAKAGARDNVARALTGGGYGRREVLLRINALSTEWGYADLVAAAAMPVAGIVLPKVESSDVVGQTQQILNRLGAPASIAIWCMIETPLGVLRVQEIAATRPAPGGLIMGTADLTKDLRARHTRDRAPLRAALGMCLVAARAYGLPILDGVHLDLSDDEGFLEVCKQGRDLGFDGKTLIHPKTIAAANEIFGPSADDVAQARRIVAAHAEAVASGNGVVLLDGRLVENLHVEEAMRVVALAKAIAAR